jgi:RND family efflux transporter MFP subunit
LRAPDDGIISSRSATTGSVPAQGAEMFRLIRQGRIEWRGEFSAEELEQLRPGQTVRIQSASGNVWLGKLRQTSPTVDASSRRGIAWVDILSPEKRDAAPIRPGSYLRGEIVLGEQTALVVPQSAIVARDGYHLVCVVSNDMRVSLRRVKLGRLVGDRQQLLDGLKPGERVVASGGAFLSEGDTVQLADSAAPAR